MLALNNRVYMDGEEKDYWEKSTGFRPPADHAVDVYQARFTDLLTKAENSFLQTFIRVLLQEMAAGRLLVS